VIKQLEDYRSGHRSSPIMQAIAKTLSEREVRDLAAYYAYLPKARTAPTLYDETLPALVRVGAPLRNIAPCISCHGGVDQKLGAPWLEGMPKRYLVNQLKAFISGTRRNDSGAQMRNMVRAMTAEEIDEVATFYARKASSGEAGVAH
jgi:cytochrome c553